MKSRPPSAPKFRMRLYDRGLLQGYQGSIGNQGMGTCHSLNLKFQCFSHLAMKKPKASFDNYQLVSAISAKDWLVEGGLLELIGEWFR